jgi:UDP-N-acetylglucosamine acyltransferase
MPDIHPTAIVDASAEIADDAAVGPYCVVEADTAIGPGTVLREHVVIRRYTRMGSGNLVGAHTVLGGEPQDFKFSPETVSYLHIGHDNIFREGVTVSRGSRADAATVVGNGTYWMVGSHAGHDTTIGDGCILTNCAAVGGHATVGPRAILSANMVVHQFCWIGEMVMTQGNAGTSCHIPPFTMLAGINNLAGLNTVGLRRAEDISDEDRRQIKQAFRITYRSGLTPTGALQQLDACSDFGDAAGRFRDFLRAVVQAEGPYRRPLVRFRAKRD